MTQQHPQGRSTDALFARQLIGAPRAALPGRSYNVTQNPVTGDFYWTSSKGGAFGSTIAVDEYTSDDKLAVASLTEVCAANEWFPVMMLTMAETGDPVWSVEIRHTDRQTVIGRGTAGMYNLALAIVRGLLVASTFQGNNNGLAAAPSQSMPQMNDIGLAPLPMGNNGQ